MMRRHWYGAAIALMVPLPSIVFYFSLLKHYHTDYTISPFWTWCLGHPLLLANVLFLLNVDLLFWFISLIQTSHWLIDLYWTVIPVLLVHYFAAYPLNQYNWLRSRVMIAMTWIWSLRLTHNYFRRENWQWGAREDWRFTDMRGHYGKHWWWLSFFLVYLSQQVLLMEICLPFYVIHMVNNPVNACDIVAIILSLCGIITAYIADTQLHGFMMKNNALRELGQLQIPCFDAGLWRCSRHPNYFGEQLWWWGLALSAWNLDSWLMFVGPFLNSLCFAYSTHLVEQRMLKQDYRANAYKTYQKTTSTWIPWFKLNSPKLTRRRLPPGSPGSSSTRQNIPEKACLLASLNCSP